MIQFNNCIVMRSPDIDHQTNFVKTRPQLQPHIIFARETNTNSITLVHRNRKRSCFIYF